ncbi:MAG TPA: AAA family ATPase [Armatimonadota bacterium]|nr:AAA family ATPase [Armatimonadota bacterium]
MRIRRLTIGRFGHFADAVLPLETGPERGLRVIYGPNEAGKTTVLHAVRHLLFGFPVRSPYNFLYDYGSFELTAELEFSSGERAEVRRVKGQGQTLFARVTGTGEEGDERWLRRRLGEPTEELFANVFGFSLAELADEERSLGTDVRDALYGGSLGAVNLEGIRKRLASEMEALMKPSPTATRPPVNAALSQYRKLTGSLSAATVQAPAFEHLQEQLRTAESAASACRERVSALRRRQALLDRAARALPRQALRRARAAELESLVVPRGFDTSCSARFEEAVARAAALEREREQLEQQRQRVAQELSGVEVDTRLMGLQDRIVALFGGMDRARDAERDLPLRIDERAALERQIQDDLTSLRPGTAASQLSRFAPKTPLRLRFDELVREAEQLEKQRRDRAGRAAELRERIRLADQRLAELGPAEDLTAIEALFEEQAEDEGHRQALEQGRTLLKRLDTRLAAARRRLDPPCSQLETAHNLLVPRVEQVEAMEREWAGIDRELSQAQDRRAEALARLREAEADLREVDQKHLPTPEGLTEARAHRERGWQLIRRAWLAGEDVTEDAAAYADDSDLATAYEAAVAAADGCADELRKHANEVAERARIALELERRKEAARAADQAILEAQERREKWTARWRAMWERCPFEPDSPTVMRAWLKDHAALVELMNDREGQALEVDRHARAVAAYEAQVRHALDDAEAPLADLLQRARRRLAEHRERESRRAAESERRESDAVALQAVERDLALLDEESRKWNTRWSAVTDELSLPVGIAPADAASTIRGLDGTRQHADRVRELTQRIDQMESALREFADEAADLARAAMPEAEGARPQEIAEQLHAALLRTLQAAEKRTQLQARQDDQEAALAAKSLEIQQWQRAASELLALAEAQDEAAFREVAARAARAEELRHEIDRLDRELREIRAEGSEDDLDALLAQCDLAAIVDERQRVENELEAAEAAGEKANQEVGQARSALERIDGGTGAAAIREDIQATLAELRSHAERYAVLAVARKLLDDEVTRFAVQHQPELLTRAGAVFAHMTGGRYSGLSRLLDERGTIMAIRPGGDQLAPWQLSTGAAQQLYLALRLAYVQHYCARSEPLPLIMDDVLVNFDDARARATLHTLAELSPEIQVLFFTCHPHLVELARSVVPGLTPIEIPAPVGGQ